MGKLVSRFETVDGIQRKSTLKNLGDIECQENLTNIYCTRFICLHMHSTYIHMLHIQIFETQCNN